ncbi:MAG: hypothetical protein K0M69_17215 [Youngiibacter sp.]|nr:hypothetical protein [Youngiibacter sp.]
MKNNKYWAILNKAEISTIAWSKMEGISIFRIEYVATFERCDNGIGVYVFFKTDKEKEESEITDFNRKVRQYYLDFLLELKYPFDRFPNVVFFFDSDENVSRNYTGSYFFRLR